MSKLTLTPDEFQQFKYAITRPSIKGTIRVDQNTLEEKKLIEIVRKLPAFIESFYEELEKSESQKSSKVNDLLTLILNFTDLSNISLSEGLKDLFVELKYDNKLNQLALALPKACALFSEHLSEIIKHNTTIQKLHFTNINTKSATFITKALQSNARILNLGFVNVEFEEASELDKLVEQNTNIKVLGFISVKYNDAKKLFNALKLNKSIEKLEINKCGTTDEDIKDIDNILTNNSTLKSLLITSESISSISIEPICKGLKQNTNLDDLFLRSNKLSNADYLRIINSAESLLTLDISSNNLQSKNCPVTGNLINIFSPSRLNSSNIYVEVKKCYNMLKNVVDTNIVEYLKAKVPLMDKKDTLDEKKKLSNELLEKSFKLKVDDHVYMAKRMAVSPKAFEYFVKTNLTHLDFYNSQAFTYLTDMIKSTCKSLLTMSLKPKLNLETALCCDSNIIPADIENIIGYYITLIEFQDQFDSMQETVDIVGQKFCANGASFF